MQDIHVELNPGLPWQKQHFIRRRLFYQQVGFNLRRKLMSANLENKLGMVLKPGHFKKQIRNIQKVLKCAAGEGWSSSVGPIV
jgi:hypothetical protein